MTRRRFVRIGAAALATAAVGGVAVSAATDAPEIEHVSMTMGEGDMRVLVVYGTKSGCTMGIAEKIGATLAKRGATVDVVAAEEAAPAEGYDAVVVGSGIRAGSWHEPARAWVTANAGRLREVPVAFYTCGMMLTQGDEKADEVRAYTDPLIEESGITPVDIGLFAGWFEPKEFSFAERTIMKLMKTPVGDFRDFEAIAAWTDSLAPRIGVA